jgi:hypothetical protein
VPNLLLFNSSDDFYSSDEYTIFGGARYNKSIKLRPDIRFKNALIFYPDTIIPLFLRSSIGGFLSCAGSDDLFARLAPNTPFPPPGTRLPGQPGVGNAAAECHKSGL